MTKENIIRVTDGLPIVSAPIDIDKVMDKAKELIDIKDDLSQIERINPKEAYELKLKAIADSDLSPEEKMRLYDESQDKHLKDVEKASEIHDGIVKKKIGNFFTVVIGLFMAMPAIYEGYQKYQDNKAKKDDICDSNKKINNSYL